MLAKIYYKKHNSYGLNIIHANGEAPTKKPLNSLEDLGSVRNRLAFQEKYSSKHIRYLNFLRELYEQTKQISHPGKISLTELKQKFKVSPLTTKVLLDKHLLTEYSPGSRKNQFKWNTIPPVMATVELLLEDIGKLESQKIRGTLEVVEKPEDIPQALFDTQQLIEAVLTAIKYHIPQPEPIDYNDIKNYIDTAIKKQLDEMRVQIIEHFTKSSEKLLISLKQDSDNLLAELKTIYTEPEPRIETKIVEVPTVKEIHTEFHHHHHHIDEAAKTEFIDKGKKSGLFSIFNKK